MDLQQAKNESDWGDAAKLLLSTVERLDRLGKSLWTENQVSVDGLRSSYRLEELYFLSLESRRVGLVFLQETDPLFWPEIIEKDTLFIHKLAIDPTFAGNDYGLLAVLTICHEAEVRGYDWVRLDCDDRPELHHFYKRCGFDLVDIKQIENFRVARHQLPTSDAKKRCAYGKRCAANGATL